jgi:hypothetical protein
LTSGENEGLLKYFSNRRAWLLEADDVPPRLSEYSASGAQVSAKAVEKRPEAGASLR